MGCPSSYNTTAVRPVLFSKVRHAITFMKQVQAREAKLNYLSSLSEQLLVYWVSSGVGPLMKAVNSLIIAIVTGKLVI